MGEFSKQRNRRGFTLTEVVAVVAIIAILAAVAFPAAGAIRRRLEMAKLDDYARTIFLAAQNELTGMKASGRLDKFAKSLGEDRRLQTAPSDFPALSKADADADADAWRDLFVLETGEGPAEQYLMQTNAALRDTTDAGGSYILEFNPVSGDVYSVFYAQRTLGYDEVTALRSRARADRTDSRIGYYGSASGDFGTVGIPDTFYPRVNVVNGEELYVTVDCGGLMSLRRTQRYLTLTVRIEDESGDKWEKTYRGGSQMFVQSDSIRVPLLLDSLQESKSFAKQFPGMTPGDNLTITAELLYEDINNDITISGKGTAQVNSLFGSRDADKNLTVSALRHLNNLRAEKYPATDGGVTITQTAPIDFRFEKWEKKNYLELTENPLKTFAPIANDALLRSSTYDGGGQPITALVIVGDHYVGLFSAVKNATLQNISLVDTAVKATGNQVGTLAGTVADTTVTNCRVYLNTKDEYGRDLDMTGPLKQYAVSGNNQVGGLVGDATGKTTIYASFAAVNVSGVMAVGGLSGQINGAEVTVQRCYGSGEVTASRRQAGGLVGYLNDGKILECYATANITAPAYGGGLVGASSGGSVGTSISVGKVLQADGTADSASSGGFVGTDYSSTIFKDCQYLKQASYNNGVSNKMPAGVSQATYVELKANSANDKSGAFPYQEDLRNNAFPFPQLTVDLTGGGTATAQLPHYGNWPAEFKLQTSLVYYEKYLESDGAETYVANTRALKGAVQIAYLGGDISKPDAATAYYFENTNADDVTTASGGIDQKAATGKITVTLNADGTITMPDYYNTYLKDIGG